MPAGLVPECQPNNSIMTPKKRPARAQTTLPSMPLSELPMMKALLAMTGVGATTRHPATKGDPKAQLTTLRFAIIDKLQVLALRRPQALVIVAQLLDALLDEQLKVLDEQRNTSPRAKIRGEAGRTAHHRSGGR